MIALTEINIWNQQDMIVFPGSYLLNENRQRIMVSNWKLRSYIELILFYGYW